MTGHDPSDATPWRWAQPTSQAELLQRLADARDFNVPERERENLCACAHTEIERLQRLWGEVIAWLEGNTFVYDPRLSRQETVHKMRDLMNAKEAQT